MRPSSLIVFCGALLFAALSFGAEWVTSARMHEIPKASPVHPVEPKNTVASAKYVLAVDAPHTVVLVDSSSRPYLDVVRGNEMAWVPTGSLEATELTHGDTASPGQHPIEATTVEVLQIRQSPDELSTVLAEVPAGKTVRVFPETSGRFVRISLDGVEGWVRSIYLDGMPSSESRPGIDVDLTGRAGSLAAEVVLREKPDREANVVGVIPVGGGVELTGNLENGFYEVSFDGQLGWVSHDYIDLNPVPGVAMPSEVPILLYHSIQEVPGDYQVTSAALEQQLAWLSENGFTSITSADLLAWLTLGRELPEKPVMITIDDGYATDWHFLELLDRYGLKGVFFLPNYAELSPGQIRTLDRAGEVCGHTVSHPILSTLAYDGQYGEIQQNKLHLEEILGKSVSCFGYPFGDYNSATNYAVVDAGYLIAYNAWDAPAVLDNSLDRWHIKRINVSGHYTLDDFIAVVE